MTLAIKDGNNADKQLVTSEVDDALLTHHVIADEFHYAPLLCYRTHQQ